MKPSGTKIWAAVGVLVVTAAAITGWAVWKARAPSAFALLDLLPSGADAYAVVDMAALQSNPAVRQLLADPPGLVHDPEYDDFLRKTGFHYQEDLRQLGIAKNGSDWVGVARLSLDPARLQKYLSGAGAAQSQVKGHGVYSYGTVRAFRLVLLNDNLAAFSISGDAASLERVLGLVDGAGGESAGAELRRGSELPAAASDGQLWAYAKLDRLQASQPQAQGLPLGPFRLDAESLQGSRTVDLSVHSGPISLDVQLQDHCVDAATAERLAGWLKAVLAILEATPPNPSEPKQFNYAALLAAVTVTPAGDSVQMHWNGNLATLLKLAGL